VRNAGAGEAFADQRVTQGQADDVGDICGDRGDGRGVGDGVQRGAADVDTAAQESVAGGVGVEALQGFLDPLGVAVEDGVADVVAQGAEVGGVVVEAFEFQQDCPYLSRCGWYVDAEGVFDGVDVGEAVPDGGVAGDPLREGDPVVGDPTAEERFGAFVDVPEAGF
jgi:hypothetical protein